MKLSKTVKINEDEKSKIKYGTVNFKEFNSIFLRIESWVMPICEENHAKTKINKLSYQIKQHLRNNLNNSFFKKRFISDVDIKLSGIKKGKKSFLSVETTFFINNRKLKFKSDEIKNQMTFISKSLTKNFIRDSDEFNFSSKKN